MTLQTPLLAVRGQATHALTHAAVASKLLIALRGLQRQLVSSDELSVQLPLGKAVRVRRLVHRGTRRPVFKVPSIKLGRLVQCESLLECDAALLFDASSTVQAFGEQPVQLYYGDSGDWRLHIPDFAVLIDGRKAFVEIKFEKDVDADVAERTRRLQASLARVGWDYHLLTEANLRRGSAIDNASAILRRARHATCDVRTLQTLERLRQGKGRTLGDFGWNTHGSPEALALASLIITGHAGVDWWDPLTDASAVWASPCTDEEGAQWPLVLSA